MSLPVRATRKRARTGSVAATDNDSGEQVAVTSEAAGMSLKRDEELWYEDGNITLVARDVEFCVFKGILAKHSPVFKDILLFYSEPPYSYHTISASVRLGHKYQMSDLLDNALTYLKSYYPTNYDDWKEFLEYGPPGFDPPRTYAIGVVNLAHLTGEVDLLLMALLVCCTIDSADLARGFEREDGSREQLTVDDIGLCYAAKTRLLTISVKIMLRVRRPELSAACTAKQNCSEELRLVLMAVQGEGELDLKADPSVESKAFGLALDAAKLCKSCHTMVDKCTTSERKAAWEQLEEIFGIELPKVASEEGQGAENGVPP
ncbi:hypothetical protein TRAPUB_6249 [Trametes pubescens]|uniref:BTB domain-containing protein n=1 Tax=Trametes pubescens TaxID=154538 RepID=A0A1M2V6G6_TRAPU|nr:hypothetical protein TRAPUB_6249 [Trametes pubescens]